MSFLKHLVGIAAPILGGIFGGPAGAALGGAIGGGLSGGAKGALLGGALGFAGGEASSFLGGGGDLIAGGGVTPPNPFFQGGGAAGGFSEGMANPFDEGGGITPPNPFAAGGAGGAGGGGFLGGGGTGFQQAVQNLFKQGGGGVGNLFGNASKFGMPLFQIMAGLQGQEQGKKLQRQAALPDPGDVTKLPGYQAGLEAIQRSMAAQGYQGSGNMMAAMAKYGGDFYNQAVGQRISSSQAQAGPVTGQLSSLALLSGGVQGLSRAFGQ